MKILKRALYKIIFFIAKFKWVKKRSQCLLKRVTTIGLIDKIRSIYSPLKSSIRLKKRCHCLKRLCHNRHTWESERVFFSADFKCQHFPSLSGSISICPCPFCPIVSSTNQTLNRKMINLSVSLVKCYLYILVISKFFLEKQTSIVASALPLVVYLCNPMKNFEGIDKHCQRHNGPEG